MPNVIALIPARGGSKGIKSKNITPLCGKPLISYTINAAISAELIHHIYVSSDDQQILSVSRDCGALGLERDPVLAQDNTPTNAVIDNIIVQLALNSDDIIILLQPTSPLRTDEHIVQAYQQFMQSPDCDGLISVTSIDSKYAYSFIIADNFLRPIAEQLVNIPRRQELPSLYLPNGAIYIFTVKKFLMENAIPKQHLLAYIMDANVSLDIDTTEDLAMAEKYITQSRSES
jgi:CMP-N,N'-diacetyllegionaminic acid synthase